MCFVFPSVIRTPASHQPPMGLSSEYSSLSMTPNPAYEEFTPPERRGLSTSIFPDSYSQDSLNELNMEDFRPSVLTAADEMVESPTTPSSPQSYDHTPLLSKQGNAVNPCSSNANKVEGEQEPISYTPWRNDSNFTLASIPSRPTSQEQHHLFGVSHTHRHANTLQPVPVHLKDVGKAQPSPPTKSAQKHRVHLAVPASPIFRRQYSPALARKRDASGIKASVSNPEQLGMKRLNSERKRTADHKQQLEEDENEPVTHIDEM